MTDHELIQKTQRQIEGIPTPEQREKFRKMKHEFGPPFERPFSGPPKHAPRRPSQK